MKRIVSFISLILVLVIASCSGKPSDDGFALKNPKAIATIKPFINPESVVYDRVSEQFFVSQTNFGVPAGGGKISRLSKSGEIIDDAFVGGLDHPKGMRIAGGKLYVSDVTQLVEIEIKSGKILRRFEQSGAKFLNDVEVDETGVVYVSDTLTNRISRLGPDGSFGVWVDDELLDHPNGLYVHEGWLYVAGWGKMPEQTVAAMGKTPPNGRLLRVNLKTKKIEMLSAQGFGNLDGLEYDGDGRFLVSDWIAGKLFHVNLDGSVHKTIDIAKMAGLKSAQGFADIAFLKSEQKIYAPMMLSGNVMVIDVAN